MRLILLIILGFIALIIATTLIGPLIVLAIGTMLTYCAYKKLVHSDKSVLGIIWWVIVGATGISIVIGALPGFVLIGGIATVVYLAFRGTSPKVRPNVGGDINRSTSFSEYESFEAEWRDI